MARTAPLDLTARVDVRHRAAFRDALPDATLLVLEDAGHDLPAERWPEFIEGLITHTDRTRR